MDLPVPISSYMAVTVLPVDPGTTQVSKTEEETKSATPSSTKVTSKVEDVADTNKTKRQRRQRSTTTEQTVKEEEKKVSCKTQTWHW